MKTKVWVVSGQVAWDDSLVHGVFSSAEKADKFVAQFSEDEGNPWQIDVEEFTVDQEPAWANEGSAPGSEVR